MQGQPSQTLCHRSVQTTIEARSTRADVGPFSYANDPSHHIFEIWRRQRRRPSLRQLMLDMPGPPTPGPHELGRGAHNPTQPGRQGETESGPPQPPGSPALGTSGISSVGSYGT